MVRRVSFILIIPFLISISANILLAQTDSSYIDTEEMLEDLLQEPSEVTNNSDLYESLEYLINHPIDLNTAKISDLQQIPEFDFESVKLIVEHRKKYGYFFSVKELNAVQGLSKEVIKKVSPFITVARSEKKEQQKEITKPTFNKIFSDTNFKLRSRFTNDLQTREGFINKKYEGTKPKVYNRMTLKYSRNYQAGFLAEKDAGESSIDEFKTYYFLISDIGSLHKFVLGDYLVEFGQGLALWSPYGFSKGSDAVYPVKKRDRTLRPYISATESNFLRGAAGTVPYRSYPEEYRFVCLQGACHCRLAGL